MTMQNNQPHDLVHFMKNITSEIEAEYKRIKKRTIEDPGTAGDEGEENWAELLREWLPQTYHVVTKGRILSMGNTASPQVDVLVLKPNYPRKLLNKKHYLSAGVIAAFECKTTLRKAGLKKSFENSKKISEVLKGESESNYYSEKHRRGDTTYIQLHKPILYGILAHSYAAEFGSTPEKAREKISGLIEEFDNQFFTHPRELVDIMCISDLATWSAQRYPYSHLWYENPNPTNPHDKYIVEDQHGPQTCYTCFHPEIWREGTSHRESTTTIGSLLASLYQKMSYKDPSLEEWSRYFKRALPLPGGGKFRVWPDILTPECKRKYDLNKQYSSNWGMDGYD